ncbi:MAG: hypothetical protein Q4A00_05675 [Flavobacteriaceae bacterium]|nr:hypothetical protein [Flavobacteriaceae bacterium]
MMQLANCTDSKTFNNTLAKVEQTLCIRQSITQAPLIHQQGKKSEMVKEIIRVIEFFLTVTGKELEQFQIIVLAGDLYERFSNDTLDDIVLMFKMARMGDFGKVFKFDTFTVMDWANAYFEKKSEEREKMIKAKKQEEKVDDVGGKFFHELPQELQEKFNQMGGKVAKLFLPEKTTELLTREKQMRELTNEGKKKKPIKFKKYI